MGNDMLPIYWENGKPQNCGDFLDVSISGSASSANTATSAVAANKLTTPRNIALSGDATGSANFDGSADISIATTVNKAAKALKIQDAGDGRDVWINYSNVGITTPSWLAAWDGPTLKCISPTNLRNTIDAAESNHTHTILYNNLILQNGGSIAGNVPTQLIFYNKQSDNNIITKSAYIRVYDDHDAATNGASMLIQSGGNMIIGSGESPLACYNTDLVGNTSEVTYITSDNKIVFYTNCQTYANKVTTTLNTDGTLATVKTTGAVWNDYAEYRICKDNFISGQVVCENGDDTLSISMKRMQPAANIVSDTFGFAIGETDEAKCPIAVSGRVLAYPFESRDSYKAGDPVCAGPNGTVSKMTREEVKDYPDRIIGTVSAIPDYETWGTGNVKVDGRIWIKV